MTENLKNIIIKKTLQENQADVLTTIDSMICAESELPLREETLYEALVGEGEFFLLKAKYEEFDLSTDNLLLDKKLNEALCITICFEDDGSRYEEIEAFVKYIYTHTEKEQKFLFGVKKVDKLSEFPLKILLSEIYPINQLEIHLGEWISSFLSKNKPYFKEHFAAIRANISQEIGITLIPLNIKTQEDLCKNEVILLDSVTKERIVAFRVETCDDKKALDIYLLKLYYIFLKLGSKYKH